MGAAVQPSNDGSQMFSSNDVFQGNAAQGIVLDGAYFVASNSNFLNNGVGILAVASNAATPRRYNQWEHR